MSYQSPQMCNCPQQSANTAVSVQSLANKVNQVHQQLTDVHQGLMDTHKVLKEVNPEMAAQVEQHIGSLANAVAQNQQIKKHAGSLLSILGTATQVATKLATTGGRRHKSRRYKKKTAKKIRRNKRR